MAEYIVKNDKVTIHFEDRDDRRYVVFKNYLNQTMELMYPRGLMMWYDGAGHRIVMAYRIANGNRRMVALHERLYERLHEFEDRVMRIVHGAYAHTEGLIDTDKTRRRHVEHYLYTPERIDQGIYDYPERPMISVRDLLTGVTSYFHRTTTGWAAARRESLGMLKRVREHVVNLQQVLDSIKVER